MVPNGVDVEGNSQRYLCTLDSEASTAYVWISAMLGCVCPIGVAIAMFVGTGVSAKVQRRMLAASRVYANTSGSATLGTETAFTSSEDLTAQQHLAPTLSTIADGHRIFDNRNICYQNRFTPVIYPHFEVNENRFTDWFIPRARTSISGVRNTWHRDGADPSSRRRRRRTSTQSGSHVQV